MAADGNVLRLLKSAIKNMTGSVAAAGSAQTDATPLDLLVNNVTGANGAKAVRLPSASDGGAIVIVNSANSALIAFPATGESLNEGAANASLSIAANTISIAIAVSDTNWYVAQDAY